MYNNSYLYTAASDLVGRIPTICRNLRILLSPLPRERERERERDMFYLTTHSTHFIYDYMTSDIWLRTILIVRKETRCRHIGYSYRLTARVLLYAPCHRQDNTYHGLCYTSCGALAGTRNSSMGPPYHNSNNLQRTRESAWQARLLRLNWYTHLVSYLSRCMLVLLLFCRSGQVRLFNVHIQSKLL